MKCTVMRLVLITFSSKQTELTGGLIQCNPASREIKMRERERERERKRSGRGSGRGYRPSPSRRGSRGGSSPPRRIEHLLKPIKNNLSLSLSLFLYKAL